MLSSNLEVSLHDSGGETQVIFFCFSLASGDAPYHIERHPDGLVVCIV